MTAEIAVLNRNAVALAADSAATLQLPEGPKIYQTNKLFRLSKYHPVGIMLYGNAEFMSVPWEMTIKRFRAGLGNRNFAQLEGYASSFLDFIEDNAALFPSVQQKVYCYAICRKWLVRLKVRLKGVVQERLRAKVPTREAEVRAAFRSLVYDDIKHLRMHPVLPRFSKSSESSILRKYRTLIRKAIKDELQLLVGSVPLRRLETGCALAIVRDLYWHSESGIVIAGFGKDDNFPRLRCYRVDSVVAGRLRAAEVRAKRCDINQADNSASLIAFAQSEMVSLFMNGIDDDFQDFIEGFIASTLMQGYPSVLDTILRKYISDPQRVKVLKQVETIGQQLTSKLRDALRHLRAYYSLGPDSGHC